MRKHNDIRCARAAQWLRAGMAVSSTLVSVPQAGAATAISTFNVAMTLQAECRIASTTDLLFGTIGVISNPVTANSTIGVQCTNATPYNVGLDQGLGTGATVTNRLLTSGGATLSYGLYRDTGYSQNWGQTVGTDTVSGTGSGGVQNLTVYGRVPSQATPAPGTYTDTIHVTITY
jgi:spore coat protein U-like protein